MSNSSTITDTDLIEPVHPGEILKIEKIEIIKDYDFSK